MSEIITRFHTLPDAIFLKSENRTLSTKTQKKMTEKLISINTCFKDNPLAYAEQISKINDSLKQIKHQRVYEQVKGMISQYAGNYYFSHSLGVNLQLRSRSAVNFDATKQLFNVCSELETTKLCNAASGAYNANIVDFSCLDRLFSYIKSKSTINMMAITKMVREEGSNNGHYSCIHVIKENNKVKLAVHEPSLFNQETERGVNNLRCLVKAYIKAGKINANAISIGLIDLGLEKKVNESYSTLAVTTAEQLCQSPETIPTIFSKFSCNGEEFSILYRKEEQTRYSNKISKVKNNDRPKTIGRPHLLRAKARKINLSTCDVENKASIVQDREEQYHEKNATVRSNSFLVSYFR